MPTKLTNELIAAAIEGYEAQKQRLEVRIAELRGLLKGHAPAAATTPEAPTGKRRKFSVATRRTMREAQRARWAKIKGATGSVSKATPASPKPKRKLSAAGRKAIAAAQKRRWALKRAEAAAGKSGTASKSAAARKNPAA